MIKVRILRGLTTVGAAALTLPSLIACTTTNQDDVDVDTGTDQNTASIAGSGVLTVHGWRLEYGSTSGGDEFIRVGEKMKVGIDFNTTVTRNPSRHNNFQSSNSANKKRRQLTPSRSS